MGITTAEGEAHPVRGLALLQFAPRLVSEALAPAVQEAGLLTLAVAFQVLAHFFGPDACVLLDVKFHAWLAFRLRAFDLEAVAPHVVPFVTGIADGHFLNHGRHSVFVS